MLHASVKFHRNDARSLDTLRLARETLGMQSMSYTQPFRLKRQCLDTFQRRQAFAQGVNSVGCLFRMSDPEFNVPSWRHFIPGVWEGEVETYLHEKTTTFTHSWKLLRLASSSKDAEHYELAARNMRLAAETPLVAWSLRLWVVRLGTTYGVEEAHACVDVLQQSAQDSMIRRFKMKAGR